jgi:hypothetical protein
VYAVDLDLLWGMIGLHLLGVAATSLLGRENLVGAMITGRKRLAAPPAGRDRPPGGRALAVRALLAAAAAAIIVAAVLSLRWI